MVSVAVMATVTAFSMVVELVKLRQAWVIRPSRIGISRDG